MKSEKKKKVFVGLSGGVDSAVSAGLLKQEGYEVVGVFIKAWTPPKTLVPRSFSGVGCGWREDRRSAMRVCAILNIPFITLDLEKEYKKEVVDYMLEEYKDGRTPNPDVMCNKEIKFGAFLDFALKNGADFVATGHYAKTSPQPLSEGKEFSETLPFGEGRVGLSESADKSKDQTYFLWTLTQEQLPHILFPIGHLEKPEVRKLAKEFGLPQATRKDSQGLCFLGKIDMKEFLSEYIKPKGGDVLDINGSVIGKHDGAMLYTLGERHGFQIQNTKNQSEPLYVVEKDMKNNTITVAEKLNAKRVAENTIKIKNSNWIEKKTPREEIECRWRYRQKKMRCKIIEKNKELFVSISSLNENISSGQSIVFYDGEKCLGGAIID